MPFLPTGRALLDAKRILQKTPLSLGMVYADFGAGNLGHFVFPAASIVGEEGRVYAVDILKPALESIRNRARFEGRTNIIPVWGNIERPGGVDIPADSVDLVSLVHEVNLLTKGPFVLEEIKRVLRRHGTLLLIDWNKKQGENIVPFLQANAFTQLETFSAGPYHWGKIFQR